MKENIILAMQKILGGWFIVIFLLVACTEDDERISSDKLITFSSYLSEITSRSLSDSQNFYTKENWSLNDTIGVFYTKINTEALSDESIINGVRNFKYVSTLHGVSTIFTSATDRDKFYYSYNNDMSKSFHAYYPYTSVVSENLIYPIDIKDQSDLPKIDLLYAVTSGDEILDGVAVPLTFKHQLSKLVLNLSDEDSKHYDDMKVTATGFYTKADFSLVDRSIAKRAGELDEIDVNVGPHRIEMLIIPQGVLNGSMSFKWKGNEAKWNITSKEFEAGKKYEYSLHLDFPNVKVSGESISKWEEEIYSIDSEKSEPESDTKIDVIDNLLVKITGDTYLVGSPQGVGLPNEWPQHKAGIGTFWMTPYEITNEQYALFLNEKGVDAQLISAGSGHKLLIDTKELSFDNKWSSKKGREYYPVTSVTWYGAIEFARWLGGDLPTEREWETACRAGSGGLFSFDDSPNGDTVGDYVNYEKTGSGTVPVKSLKSNKYGLYNMHGNVFEWCLDAVERSSGGSPYSYDQGDVIFKQSDETFYIVRGGSWKSPIEKCRSAFRESLLPIPEHTVLLDDVGFRVIFPIKNILDINVENLETVMSLVK